MTVQRTIEENKFRYFINKDDSEAAYLQGMLYNEFKVLGLWDYIVDDAANEPTYSALLLEAFKADCLEHNTKVIITKKDRTVKTMQLVQKGGFRHEATQYVFENDLKKLPEPTIEFLLKPYEQEDKTAYKAMYFACLDGDPQTDLTGLNPETLFERDKNELGDMWNEELMHMVYHDDVPIGILNLRTEMLRDKSGYEGTINYFGLRGEKRNKGLGTPLHLTGLHKLKSIGCVNYFGGTDSHNQPMLRVFEKNNCHITQEQLYFRVS